MKRLRRQLALGLLAAAFGLVTCFGCSVDTPTEPAKTPEQLAAEELAAAREAACVQTSFEVSFRQGGGRVTRWPSRDDVVVVGDPKNAAGAVLELRCNFARAAAWGFLVGPGLRCTPFGSVRGLAFDINCEGDGLVVALATHTSQGKTFNDESAGFVSSVGVSSRRPLEASSVEDLVLGLRRDNGLPASVEDLQRARRAAAELLGR